MAAGTKPKKHCYLAGDHDGMTETFHLLLIYILATICIVEIIFSIVLAITEFPKRSSIIKKVKLFLIPLLSTDFLIGCTFVPLFVLESTKEGKAVDCSMSVARILMFTYYYLTRFASLVYIGFLTYRKTYMETETPKTDHDESFTYVVNISLLWCPGICSIFSFGFSSVETNPYLASVTFLYFIFTIACSVACYYMVHVSINRTKSEEDLKAFTDTKYLRDAYVFGRKAFLCFVAINVPLLICAIIFVVNTYAPDKVRDNVTVQDLYLATLALTLIQGIGNCVVFVQKMAFVRPGFLKTCSIIIFHKQIKFHRKLHLGFLTNSGGCEERPLAGVERDEHEDREDGSEGGGSGPSCASQPAAADAIVKDDSHAHERFGNSYAKR